MVVIKLTCFESLEGDGLRNGELEGDEGWGEHWAQWMGVPVPEVSEKLRGHHPGGA